MGREREDGHIYFVGGLVAFPGASTSQHLSTTTRAKRFLWTDERVRIGFYLLSEKIGKSMFDVHVPVPQFNEKLLTSVERCV